MTKDQEIKINEISAMGYVWNKQLSISAAGVIMVKGNNIWFFGLNGEIEFNPTGIKIKIK